MTDWPQIESARAEQIICKFKSDYGKKYERTQIETEQMALVIWNFLGVYDKAGRNSGKNTD